MKFRFEGTLEEFKTVFKADLDTTSYTTGMEFLASEEDEALLGGSPPLGIVEGEGKGKIVQLDTADHGGRKMTEAERERAYASASEFFSRYAKNFGLTEEEQPNRADLIEEFGHGRDTIPFLLLCYEYGSMQKLAGELLLPLRENGLLPIDSTEGEQAWWKWVDLLCCNVVQVSIAGFPDLQGTYDYSNRWKREALGEA